MLTLLALILIGVLAAAIVVASLHFFLRARRREEATPDPADAVVEMRALGQRIETLVGQQQLQGETARQQLAQKMDTVGQAVDQQRHGLAGLQNELRHEVRRRDAEMEDLRTQLASIQQAPRLGAPAPALALPEAPAPAETPAPEVPTFELPAAETPVFETPTFEEPSFDVPAFETPTFETPVFETPTFSTPAFEASTGDGMATAFSDDGWDTGAAPPVFSDPFATADPDAVPALPVFEPVSPFAESDPFATPVPDSEFEPFDFVPPDDAPALPSFAPAQREAVSFENITPAQAVAVPTAPAPPSDTAWISRAGRADVAAEVPAFSAPAFETPTFETPTFETPAFAPALETPAFSAPAFAPPAIEPPTAKAPAPAEPPAGADRLTRIASIDDAMETALYAAGVTTLDEIARWSRTDARRIAAEVSVTEDAIMNQWIFEAQAALFQSYASAQQGR